jgi:hypothetical protein
MKRAAMLILSFDQLKERPESEVGPIVLTRKGNDLRTGNGKRACPKGTRSYRASDGASMAQPPIQTWRQRRRRQRIFGAIVAAVLIAALLYGWLRVFGQFSSH